VVDQLAPPTGYSSIWAVLFVVVTVVPLAAVGIRFSVPFLRRRFANRSTLARARALARIDEIENNFVGGSLTSRAAHSALSATVREFASRPAMPADRMTLRALEVAQVDTTLSGAVRRFYDGTFDLLPVTDVAEAAARARSVVSAWN
jgi:hypothetical protein